MSRLASSSAMNRFAYGGAILVPIAVLEVNLIVEGEAVHGENLFHHPEEVLCWGGLGWAGLEGFFACCHALIMGNVGVQGTDI